MVYHFKMKVTSKHIEAYKNLINEEIPLIAKFDGVTVGSNYANLYHDMIDYLVDHSEEFIFLSKSDVKLYEYEFVEHVDTLFEIFQSEALAKSVPTCVWFMPSVRVEGSKFVVLIHKEIAQIIRTIFDTYESTDFATYRTYELHHTRSEILLWAKCTEGKDVLKETSKKTGIPQNKLIVGKLKLFDDSFITAQYKYVSEWTWVHKKFIEAFNHIKK